MVVLRSLSFSQDMASRRGVRVHALDTTSFMRSCVGGARGVVGVMTMLELGKPVKLVNSLVDEVVNKMVKLVDELVNDLVNG